MKNFIKYSVSVKHLMSYDAEFRKAFYTRVIGMYDSLDEAVDKFAEVIRYEPYSSEADILQMRIDLENSENDFDTQGSYSYVLERMYDRPGKYEGPGAYVIDKRRMQ